MTEFKFRAECWMDVLRFLANLADLIPQAHMTALSVTRHPQLSDCDVSVTTTHTRDELIAVANETVDCHVIAETIQPIAEYTGVRVKQPISFC